jgi:hypothetical protein
MGEKMPAVQSEKRVAILIVSDYAGGEEKSWNDLRKAFRAWAEQDYTAGPVDYFLVESSRYESQVPADLFEILPNLRTIFHETQVSYELKNFGMEQMTAEFVGIVDADCIPNRGWVAAMVAGMERDPRIASVAGPTTYPGRNRMERILGLLSRAYLHPGREGPTRYVSGNAAGYRRSAFLDHPLPVGLGPFASRVHSEALLRSGWKLHFQPAMHTVHDFEGWPMERDIRRHQGYGTVITRLHDPEQPYAWLARLGPVAIPAIAAGKTFDSFCDVFRCARFYGVRWYEIPMALVLAVWTHVMEIPGMRLAYRGEAIQESAYR